MVSFGADSETFDRRSHRYRIGLTEQSHQPAEDFTYLFGNAGCDLNCIDV